MGDLPFVTSGCFGPFQSLRSAKEALHPAEPNWEEVQHGSTHIGLCPRQVRRVSLQQPEVGSGCQRADKTTGFSWKAASEPGGNPPPASSLLISAVLAHGSAPTPGWPRRPNVASSQRCGRRGVWHRFPCPVCCLTELVALP